MTEEEALNSGGTLYRHYKGGIYRLKCDATHSETKEQLIVYFHVWPHEPQFWVRPADMFFGMVEVDGKKVRRFRLILPDSFPHKDEVERLADAFRNGSGVANDSQ